MKNILPAFLLYILQACNSNEIDFFENISNKTWLEDKGFAGTNIVFYKTGNGLQKSIRQINGSGLPVVSSEIYDVELQQDTIYLINGLNLIKSEKLADVIYTFNKNTNQIFVNKEPIHLIRPKAILFAWTPKEKYKPTQIDANLLSGIPIEKNKIYNLADIENILAGR